MPDHDSGHSVEGGAAAQVLRRFFRTDHIAFSTCSLTLPPGPTCADVSPVLRSYGSFTQAAGENGLSRILVGFHFRNAVEQGIEHGRAIGNHVVSAPCDRPAGGKGPRSLRTRGRGRAHSQTR